MSETTEIQKSKISELPEQTSPSTSAKLVGVDNGETVQIHINFFQELIDGKLPYLNILWNSPTDTISTIIDALDEADLLLASYKPVVRLYGYGSALLLCSGGKGADGRVNLYATNLYDGKVVQSIGVHPTTVTISDFLAQESVSTYQEQINELKEAVEGKAESDHGHSYNDLTDKPTIPSVEGLASETYVDEKVAGIVNSAPETLDTLNELSKALGNDPNFAASIATQIGNKVDKVSGKGLSTNDYTTAEKNKLAGLSTVATSGSYNDLKDKPTIPSIAGLATEKYVDDKIANLPSGGGSSSGGGASIIDITEEPSNPDTSAIYREWQPHKVHFTQGQTENPYMSCTIVDVLPETGEMAFDGTYMKAYYQRADNKLYGYVDAVMSAQMNAPVGWYDDVTLMGAMGYTYGGQITSLDEATDSSAFYAFVTKKPYLCCYYNNGSTIEKLPIITSNNFDFDEDTGTLVLNL